ncbi:hypothetical protein DRO41_06305 [Candidatus Bathyarchaeota archaeon]|nr:MAG: hypothetical protein DRO41_06305 [Candidatus Bathyarchaeota archaeon]
MNKEEADENDFFKDMLIRDFCKSDLHDLLDVARLSFAPEFELTGFDVDRIKKLVNQAFGPIGRIFLGFSKIFGKERFKFFVAEVNSRVVGGTMVTKHGRIGYISTVMVHPAYRRKGIARRLMESALNYIHKRNMRRAVLHVVSTNVPAKNLYTKLGFKEFEKITYLVSDTDSLSELENIEGVQVRSFQKDDINAVYSLMKSSEDPKHLEILDFKKDDLKTPLITRVFHLFRESRMVALYHNKVIGYVQATYTTANEAGRIINIQVHPKMRGKGVEELLISSAINEIKKKIGVKKILGTASLKRPELIVAMERLGFKKHFELSGMFLETTCLKNM